VNTTLTSPTAKVMTLKVEFEVVCPATDGAQTDEILRLLAVCQVRMDADVEVFVAAYDGRRLIACAGLSNNVIKCVAIDAEYRGDSVSQQLISKIVALAAQRDHVHLFLHAQPCDEQLFCACGFYPLVRVPDTMVLLENTPVGISDHCDQLRQTKREGSKIGCIVMNANPFTKGHEYLVRCALQACDWLHVFVVSEDGPQLRYGDRFRLVSRGLAGLDRLTIHYGSDYMVSTAAIPGYVMKDGGVVDHCRTAIDLLLFRQYIAPALGITHRFIGTEPFCAVAQQYNEEMKYWLSSGEVSGTPIDAVEVTREVKGGIPVSAAAVRRLLAIGDFVRIRPLVPDCTFRFLLKQTPIPSHSLHIDVS
jgi:[citrate (pro-3S)-lyase] ligase